MAGSSLLTRRPPAWRVIVVVVGHRVVAAQREAEAVLARRCAVTGARIAAGLGEHRYDLVAEGDRRDCTNGGRSRVRWHGPCHRCRAVLRASRRGHAERAHERDERQVPSSFVPLHSSFLVNRQSSQSSLEQLFDRLDAVIDDRHRPPLRARQFLVDVDAERRTASSRPRLPRAPGDPSGMRRVSSDAPTTWPPFTPPPAIDIVQHCGQWSRPPAGLIFGVRPNSPIATTSVLSSRPRLAQILEQRRVGVVEHRPEQIAVRLDRAERRRAVDVPRDLVEHRLEHVDRDEAHAGLDQPPRQQAAHAEAVAAVLFLQRRRAPSTDRTPPAPSTTRSACRPDRTSEFEQPRVGARLEAR